MIIIEVSKDDYREIGYSGDYWFFGMPVAKPKKIKPKFHKFQI